MLHPRESADTLLAVYCLQILLAEPSQPPTCSLHIHPKTRCPLQSQSPCSRSHDQLCVRAPLQIIEITREGVSKKGKGGVNKLRIREKADGEKPDGEKANGEKPEEDTGHDEKTVAATG